MTRVDMIGGNRAGVRREQRHERLSRQAELAHDFVHHERRARQVAGVFQQRQREK
jgi:hypothetical protein